MSRWKRVFCNAAGDGGDPEVSKSPVIRHVRGPVREPGGRGRPHPAGRGRPGGGCQDRGRPDARDLDADHRRRREGPAHRPAAGTAAAVDHGDGPGRPGIHHVVPEVGVRRLSEGAGNGAEPPDVAVSDDAQLFNAAAGRRRNRRAAAKGGRNGSGSQARRRRAERARSRVHRAATVRERVEDRRDPIVRHLHLRPGGNAGPRDRRALAAAGRGRLAVHLLEIPGRAHFGEGGRTVGPAFRYAARDDD